MKTTLKTTFALSLTLAFLGLSAEAHQLIPQNYQSKPILADLQDLKTLQIPVLAQDPLTNVGYAIITPKMEQALQLHSHSVGKCAGFEDLTHQLGPVDPRSPRNLAVTNMFTSLHRQHLANETYKVAPFAPVAVVKNAEIEKALSDVSTENIRNHIQWLSAFPSRDNRAADPNVHVVEMEKLLKNLLKDTKIPYQVDLISHESTRQKSVRVRLVGKSRPEEIIVLGGHLDSINHSWGGGNKTAPGADDNASGSADLVEALRIVMAKAQPERTVEFFWYAGEESGLLGSAEIAEQYKAENKNVIAVMQLDMTLFAGSGEFVIGNMTDFTSAWLRDYFKAVNTTYLHAKIVDDKCGYGCSDHASWHRQGYPALMPFEATMRNMNQNIHTSKDVISSTSNFQHSTVFAKLAVVFAMDLANSDQKQPY